MSNSTFAVPLVTVDAAQPCVACVRFFLTSVDVAPVEEFEGQSVLEVVARKLPTRLFKPRSLNELVAWHEGPAGGEFVLSFEDEEEVEGFFSNLAGALPPDLSLGAVLAALVLATDGFTAVADVLILIPDIAAVQPAACQ